MAGNDISYVLKKLTWMKAERIWPNGLRYLWTDAFGVVLLISLYETLGEDRYLNEAAELVTKVTRVLGRPRGIRIGEEPDRDGQYFHYLAMWLYALAVLGRHRPDYRRQGIDLVHQIHKPFLVPETGIIWKMREDLSGPYPGYGLGALDAFQGYVTYRVLAEDALAEEIADMARIMDRTMSGMVITQDLAQGMMLWLSHFFPEENWAIQQRSRCLATLDGMWNETGFFCRDPDLPTTKFAFTNYGVSIGLQAVGAMPARVAQLNRFFDHYRSDDEYDRAAITHVMACSSHLPGALISPTMSK
jgi:hypothetical protein